MTVILDTTTLETTTPGTTKLQSDMNNILKWTSEHFLSLNQVKSQVMIVGNRYKVRKRKDPKSIVINGIDVKFVKQYNYLGIVLDDEMTLQPLLKHVKKILHNRLFSIRKIRKYITDKAAISIYKHTIMPIVDYSGFMILSCCTGERF